VVRDNLWSDSHVSMYSEYVLHIHTLHNIHIVYRKHWYVTGLDYMWCRQITQSSDLIKHWSVQTYHLKKSVSDYHL